MATTRDYEHRLTNAAADLDHIRGTNLDGSTRSPLARARTNLRTWAGHGAGRTGYTGSRSSGGHDLGDQVAAAVDAGRSLTADEHAEQLATLDKQIIRVEHELARLRKLVDAATLTVDPTTAARRTSLDECRLCATIHYHNVVLARGLCSSCWRLSQRLGTDAAGQPIDPHTDLVRLHNEGRRITVNLIARYHPIATDYDQVISLGETVPCDQTREEP